MHQQATQAKQEQQQTKDHPCSTQSKSNTVTRKQHGKLVHLPISHMDRSRPHAVQEQHAEEHLQTQTRRQRAHASNWKNKRTKTSTQPAPLTDNCKQIPHMKYNKNLRIVKPQTASKTMTQQTQIQKLNACQWKCAQKVMTLQLGNEQLRK